VTGKAHFAITAVARQRDALVQSKLPLLDMSSEVEVVPYPPGVPLLMPGENVGPADGVYLSYFRALQVWDWCFPDFEPENYGVEDIDGPYFVYCLRV
jgi:arginine/lysine/ornithine decarboxylase